MGKPPAPKRPPAEQERLFEPNLLYYGDNLHVLREHIRDETIDLIYLDPPFNSGQDYNILFRERGGEQPAAQVKAFEDTWHWDQAAWESYQETVRTGPHEVSEALQAFRRLVGRSDMLAYLSMMAPRLIELRRVLRSAGSIYLHCDPTASHYLKLLMDAVFGAERFQNEIIWGYRGEAFPSGDLAASTTCSSSIRRAVTTTSNPNHALLGEHRGRDEANRPSGE